MEGLGLDLDLVQLLLQVHLELGALNGEGLEEVKIRWNEVAIDLKDEIRAIWDVISALNHNQHDLQMQVVNFVVQDKMR